MGGRFRALATVSDDGRRWTLLPQTPDGPSWADQEPRSIQFELIHMASPRDRYQHQLDLGELLPDAKQAAVIDRLQSRYDLLLQPKPPWWRPWAKTAAIRGIYLVGSVGRGKTALMDLFVESLQAAKVGVERVHFHRFMASIQDQLKALDGTANPLDKLADRIAEHSRVLCFDEFHVEDIGDAMILGGLLEKLFERQVVTVMTSNTHPDNLYADGLQRARFLPAIDQIKTHCEVVWLDADQDYRMRTLTQAPTYFSPINAQTDASMGERFVALSGAQADPGTVEIMGRRLPVIGQTKAVVWLSFEVLFQSPRSSRDYIALIERFPTILVSHVPQLDGDDNDAAKRLIHFIDEAYDRSAKLIIQADTPPDDLYQGKRLSAAFKRTASRLIEMQSVDYLENAGSVGSQ